MKKFATCLALVMLASSTTAVAQGKEPYPGLDAYITKATQDWKIPGLAVAIVRHDSVLYTKGYGTLGVANHAPVNEKTMFEIGSSSKSFTATAIAMLVSDGKMRWDAPLTEYLPDFRMYDPVANTQVTIRDALSHRSGIARGELVWVGAGISRAEVLHRLRFLKPESPFRSQWSYQNMMFLAAGEAAGKAAGTSWDELVRQRIFAPLGMTSSVTTYKGYTNTNTSIPHGLDHDTTFIRPQFDAEDIAPAGSIVSNAVDMAQYLRFQMNDGVVNGKRLVSSAALRETHTPQMVMTGRGGGAGGDSVAITHFNTYGFGWMIEDYRGQLVWQHGGNTTGMTTAMGMMPEKKFGVVVLSNMGQAALPELLRQYIFDLELGAPKRDLSGTAYARSVTQRRRADSVAKVQEALHPAGAQPTLPLASYVGTFADSLYGPVNVAMKDGHLELTRGDWSGPLQYWNATNFRWIVPPASPTGPLNIKFEVSPDNVVTGLYFGLGNEATLLSRVGGGRGGRGGRGGGR
jgi:CubicO group peptidase (beta-lactamase class C family)